jgi:hypothetical protein
MVKKLSYKVQKIILHKFNNTSKLWTILYPKTSGDMVLGQVSDSKLFDGHETKDFMPSTFSSFMRVVDTSHKPQGFLAKKAIFHSDYDYMENYVNVNFPYENSVWVQNEVYVENGLKRLSTREYVDNVHGMLIGTPTLTATGKNTSTNGEIYNHLVYRAEEADKLTSPRNINNIPFDGTKDIFVPFYIVSDYPPANKELLWIKASTHVLCYYDKVKKNWYPTTAVWQEEKDKVM